MNVVLRTVLGRAVLRPASDRPEPIMRRNITLSPRHGTPAVLVKRRMPTGRAEGAPEPTSAVESERARV